MVKKITNIFHIYGINHLIVRMTLRDSRQILEHVWSTVLVQPITAYWHGLPPVSLLLHLPLHFILLLNTATEWSHQNTNRSAPIQKFPVPFLIQIERPAPYLPLFALLAPTNTPLCLVQSAPATTLVSLLFQDLITNIPSFIPFFGPISSHMHRWLVPLPPLRFSSDSTFSKRPSLTSDVNWYSLLALLAQYNLSPFLLSSSP